MLINYIYFLAIWSRNATLLFLSLYQEHASNIDRGKCSQKHAFQEISKKLAEKSYPFSSKQCMTKLTTMKRMYKKIKDHNSKSGNDRQTWQYFEVSNYHNYIFYNMKIIKNYTFM